MAYNKVKEWPAHKRPDMDRDKYGPLPNTSLPPLKALMGLLICNCRLTT